MDSGKGLHGANPDFVAVHDARGNHGGPSAHGRGDKFGIRYPVGKFGGRLGGSYPPGHVGRVVSVNGHDSPTLKSSERNPNGSLGCVATKQSQRHAGQARCPRGA